MAELSREDEMSIVTLKQIGILKKLNYHLFNPTRCVVVICSDGQRLFEALSHLYQIAKEVEPSKSLDEYIIHTEALNGGALLLDEDAPVVSRELHEDLVLIRHIEAAIKIKQLDANGTRPTVILFGHIPCGAATLAGLTLPEQMDVLVNAKERLKAYHPKWRIPLCIHVHYPKHPTDRKGPRDRSYIFSSKEYKRWRRDNPDFPRGYLPPLTPAA